MGGVRGVVESSAHQCRGGISERQASFEFVGRVNGGNELLGDVRIFLEEMIGGRSEFFDMRVRRAFRHLSESVKVTRSFAFCLISTRIEGIRFGIGTSWLEIKEGGERPKTKQLLGWS